MKKKLLLLNTAILLGIGSFLAAPNAHAASNSHLQSVKDQRSAIQSNISKSNQQINQLEGKLASLNEQIQRTDQAVQDNNQMITDTKTKIANTKSSIKTLNRSISALKERIVKRSDILKKRIRDVQQRGGNVDYLQVLLGSTSFSDFVDRVGAVTTMMKADQNLIDQQEADKKALESKQEAVKTKLKDLTDTQTELEGMQEQIIQQKAENDKLKSQLSKQEKDSAANRDSLKQQDTNLASKQKAIEESMKADQETAGDQESQDQNSSGSDSSSNAPAPSYHAPAENESSPSGNKSKVISAGYKYIGHSVYVFGGGRSAYDIANGRFDCSGFVHWAFAQGGYNVGSSTDSLKNAGRQISYSEIQPGDLVFFNTYKTDGHVGIYIGGGKFIGSQSSTGVAIANMNSGYWKQHFNGRVVRI